MKKIGIAMTFLFLLSAGSCLDETDTLTPTTNNCEENGGTLEFGPLSGSEICVAPTPDAGNACSSSADCSGHCLAETSSCTPVAPYFGCYDVLLENGDVATLCME